MPLIVISAISIWNEYQALNNETKRSTSFQAQIAVRALDQWICAQEDSLKSLATLPSIVNLNLQEAKVILETANETQTSWEEVALISPDGQPLITYSPCSKQMAKEISQAAFFKEILYRRAANISGYMSCKPGKGIMVVGAPVLDQGKIKAVLLAFIKPKAILQVFQGLGEANGSIIAVVDQEQTLLARTLEHEKWAGKDFSHASTVKAASKAWKGNIEGIGIVDPIARVYAFDRVPRTQWLVIIGVPTASIYSHAHQGLIMLVIFSVAAIAFSLLLAIAATRHFTYPIHDLVREALAIGRGDFHKRARVRAQDELGLLARAFNLMAQNLELSMERRTMVEQIVGSMRRSLNLDEMLNTLAKELSDSISCSRVAIALMDKNKHSGDYIEFGYIYAQEGILNSQRKFQIARSSSVNMTMQELESQIFESIEEKELNDLFLPVKHAPNNWKEIHSLVLVPISSNNKFLGLLLVEEHDVNRIWLNSEIELIEDIADHLAVAIEQSSLFEMTKTLAEQEQLINHIVRSVRSSLDLDTILNTVSIELGRALNVDRCQIVQPTADGPLTVTHEFYNPLLPANKGLSVFSDLMNFSPDSEVKVQDSILGIPSAASASNMNRSELQAAAINDTAKDPRTATFHNFLELCQSKSLVSAPLIDGDNLLGILLVHQCQAKRVWQDHEVRLVMSIADQVSVAISHARLFAQVKHQAISDGLTGLYNHVYIKNRIKEEIKRARRKGTTCSLLMVDLDKLKQINDNLGHLMGDTAIKQVARVLKNILRSGDTAARYGGEEFGIILPDTSLNEANLIAERICREVNAQNIPGLGRISVSIGASCYPQQAIDPDDLMIKADKALYVAKNGGRNQVRVFSETSLNV